MFSLFEAASFFALSGLQEAFGSVSALVAPLLHFLSDGFGTLKAQGADVGGGVGNLVAAALQTKGLIDQATILSKFKDTLVWIAALGWLFSICMAIGSVAVFGGYRQGLYLLVGPPLFYFMITTTASTNGTRVIVGDDEVIGAIQDQNRLLRWTRLIQNRQGAAQEVQVSFFFAVYDSIVTEMVQKIVSVVLNGDNRNHLRFVARERARSFLLQSIPTESPLSSLIVGYHFGECGEAVAALQLQASDKNKVPIEHRVEEDIENAETRILDVKWTKKYILLSKEVRQYLIGMRGTTDQEGNQFPDVPFENDDDHTAVSCEQIWGWVRGSIFFFAASLLNPDHFQATFGDPGSNTPWAQVYQDLRQWLQGAPPGGGPSEVDPVKVLAAFLYKNAAADSTHSALQSQIFSRSPFNSKQYEAVFGDLTNAEGHGGYFKLRYFATSIPYIQGLLLYLLSVSFPFFAVFLVLPGRATSFIVWCSLWVWVKSWDIGFALVFVARDIFWHFFNNRVNIYEQSINWDTPADVIKVAFSNDPLMHENVYWVLVSMLTVSVPILTAHLCMGASGLFDMFKGSIDQTANRFAGIEANRARRSMANKTETQMRHHAHLMAALYADANARNPMATNGNPLGAQTALGDSVYNRNWEKGIMWGGVNTKDGLNGKAPVEARPQLTGASYELGGFLLFNSNRQFRQRMDMSVTAIQAQELQNKKDNAAAGRPNMPERIFNPYRGMVSMSATLDQQSLDRYAGAMKELYGEGSKEHREAQAIKPGTMTWDDFFQREGERSADMQDRLAVQTRRKMYLMAQLQGHDQMNRFVTQQMETARHARNIFDGINVQQIPGGEIVTSWFSGGEGRPDNAGLTYDESIFSGGSAAPSKGSGGVDADGDGD